MCSGQRSLSCNDAQKLPSKLKTYVRVPSFYFASSYLPKNTDSLGCSWSRYLQIKVNMVTICLNKSKNWRACAKWTELFCLRMFEVPRQQSTTATAYYLKGPLKNDRQHLI